MSGINFKSPIVFFLSMALIVICALPEYEKTLNGFISKPLYLSSGFITCCLSLILLIMQIANVKKGMELLGEVLSYAYGVFITIIIALMFKNWDFGIVPFTLITLVTLLIVIVRSSIEEKFVFIDKWFNERLNINARKWGFKLLSYALILFALLFAFYRLFTFEL
ncbi:hypothetical protein [Shewanella frigidimarina]|uniref:Uncharacterized protein n=1 Tax=Shewanella frigidimarina TaxID=56812 RepID=A0A125BED3_SHEFR|nr:hypothetical protein [Shewanella frigidimarina]KVX01475.1 hypothetical protein AWJ07_17190 [Shewanella frigidimarina]KVX01477.1 hypothetical protein AWJ07_17200 [Shewanella frigidimarina]